MVLIYSSSKQFAATWRGLLADPMGQMGLAMTAAFVVISPIVGLIVKSVIDVTWKDSWDYDPMVSAMAAIVVIAVLLVVAFIVGRRTWLVRSSGVGSRCDQSVVIDRGWLTYSFRVVGDIHFNARNVIVARLASQETSVQVTQPSGQIRLEGGVWRYLDFDVTHPGTKLFLSDGTILPPTGGAVPPIEQLEYIGTFSIPDSFEPNLYQTIMENYKL